MTAPVAIEARSVVKRYGERTVVSVDSLQIHEHEVLAILGPNGAGKSTLFRLLALLEKPDAGSVFYSGEKVDIHDLAARRRTAAVFQRPLLFQGTVEDNIRFGLRFRRLRRPEMKARIQRTLELMGITQLAGADMRTLSGGELQRVALARALALEPEILFLDEPTSNLDVHVRRRFREDLRRVVDNLAATVIIITHEHSEALALAQRVAVIQDGSVVQIGTCSPSRKTLSWPTSPGLRPSGTARPSPASRDSAPCVPRPASWSRLSGMWVTGSEWSLPSGRKTWRWLRLWTSNPPVAAVCGTSGAASWTVSLPLGPWCGWSCGWTARPARGPSLAVKVR